MTKDLLPLESYLSQVGFWRMTITLAAAFGLSTALWFWLLGMSSPLTFTGLVPGALIYGLLLARIIRSHVATLYSKPAAEAPHPLADEYDFRVLAAPPSRFRYLSPGHLYAGPAGLLYVPYSGTATARAAHTASWEQVTGVGTVTLAAPLFARTFSETPLSHLRIGVGSDNWLFRIPDAERVGAKLQEYLRRVAGAVSVERVTE